MTRATTTLPPTPAPRPRIPQARPTPRLAASPVALAVSMATQYLEVRGGRRSRLQMRGVISHHAYWRLGLALRLRPWRNRTRGGVSVVRATHQRPSPGVVESVIVLRDAERIHAVAMRLEQRGADWAVTDIGLPEDQAAARSLDRDRVSRGSA